MATTSFRDGKENTTGKERFEKNNYEVSAVVNIHRSVVLIAAMIPNILYTETIVILAELIFLLGCILWRKRDAIEVSEPIVSREARITVVLV